MTALTICFILLILALLLFISYCIIQVVGLYSSDSNASTIDSASGSWYMRTRDEHLAKGHTEKTEYTNYGKLTFPITSWVDEKGNKVNDWD